MQIYNSLSHKKEEFIPNTPGKVSMYTCGPTVYHYAHIGNLRSYIMEDVLEKYLRFTGLDVKRVMNITDVGHLTSDGDTGDDKMLKGAKREHKTFTLTFPEVGFITPATILSIVLLPEPLRPTSPTTSPLLMLKLTLFRAVNSVYMS